MVRRLEVAIELAKKDKVVFDAKMKDKKQREEIEQKRLRILEADNAKKARMKDMMDKAMAAYAEGKYVEAEAFAKRAMEIDPNEVAAVHPRLQGQDRAAVQGRHGEQRRQGGRRRQRPSRTSTRRRSADPEVQHERRSSSPRTSRT